ncbi:MAG: hypothetical protein ACR652_05365 [Methylocystis sp.]|uniref:hypothetical protein n=1 Tax=Methylocystis sp. TaxID=1911079 RepID=UPI003DA52ECE
MRTTPCRLTVSLEHIGRDGLLAIASVEVSIGGVPLTIHGLEGRRGLDGTLQISTPGISHAGVIMPAIELPIELERAIGREISALLK